MLHKLKFKKLIAGCGALALGAIIFAACSQNATSGAQAAANNNDAQTSASALRQLQIAQPTPLYKWSQLRETQIEIENTQANTTQTTSFGFNMGELNPVWSCPSIGVPIASDTELTNPQQAVTSGGGGNGGWAETSIGQADPTGVYAGESTGTYVVCVAPNGSNYLQYWEGYVDSVTGPAVWNTTTHAVTLTGPSTVTVKTKP